MDFEFADNPSMDRVVSDFIQVKFVDYALSELATGRTNASFANFLPKLVEKMYTEEATTFVYDFRTHYRDYEIASVENFNFTHMPGNETEYMFDHFDLNSQPAPRDHAEHLFSMGHNENECGIFQVKNRSANLFAFVYYKYSPYEHVIRAEDDQEFRSSVNEILKQFLSRNLTMDLASAKIKNLTAQSHCWNFVLRANTARGLEFFDCQNEDNLLSMDELRRQLNSKFENRSDIYCFLTQFYRGAISSETLSDEAIQSFSSFYSSNRSLNAIEARKIKPKGVFRTYKSKSIEIKSSLRLVASVLVFSNFFFCKY